MNIIDELKSMTRGDYCSRRALEFFKKKGFIWEYSEFGYLEGCRIRCNQNRELYLEISSKGNCALAEQFDSMFDGYRQLRGKTTKSLNELLELFGCGHRFEYEGMQFEIEYRDGCFKPYLVKS